VPLSYEVKKNNILMYKICEKERFEREGENIRYSFPFEHISPIKKLLLFFTKLQECIKTVGNLLRMRRVVKPWGLHSR
jgi:hypothetical protein